MKTDKLSRSLTKKVWRKTLTLKPKNASDRFESICYNCIKIKKINRRGGWVETFQTDRIIRQDGRLASAYFWPNYKYFDQILQTVKKKTTVLILVCKEFLKIISSTDFCTLCKTVSRFSLEKIWPYSAEKFRRVFPSVSLSVSLTSGIEKFYAYEGNITIFPWKILVSHSRKIS